MTGRMKGKEIPGMTLRDIVEMVTDSGNGQYDADQITAWISEIEGQAVDEVINHAEGDEVEFRDLDYGLDPDRELLIPDRFRDVYLYYARAKVDFLNQETERYNNDVAMFDAAYTGYAAWFRRTHRQKCQVSFSRM